MSEARFRTALPEDLPAQRDIIRICFGDTQEEADAYLREEAGFDASSMVAEKDGAVVSTFSILRGVTLLTAAGDRISCPYLYALGTHPSARGHGYGIQLFRAAAESALAHADSVCCAAFSVQLREMYDRCFETQTLGRTWEAAFRREELLRDDAPVLKPVSPEEYAQAREGFLKGTAHAVYGPGMWRLAAHFGIQFFRAPGLLAMTETKDGCCLVREMLSEPGGYAQGAAALASACDADRFVIRTPLFLKPEGVGHEGEVRDYVFFVGKAPSQEDFWFPLTLE